MRVHLGGPGLGRPLDGGIGRGVERDERAVEVAGGRARGGLHDGGGAQLGEQRGPAPGRERGVDDAVGGARVQDAEESEHRLGAPAADHGDAVARPDSGLPQRPGELPGAAVQLGPGPPARAVGERRVVGGLGGSGGQDGGQRVGCGGHGVPHETEEVWAGAVAGSVAGAGTVAGAGAVTGAAAARSARAKRRAKRLPSAIRGVCGAGSGSSSRPSASAVSSAASRVVKRSTVARRYRAGE